MDRFHIVVANCERLSSFTENFHLITNFDPERDRVYIFDCQRRTRNLHSSSEPERPQVAVADTLTAHGLEWGTNLFFVKRRNWGEICGAQLDYFRCLLDGTIPLPEYSSFMQEHYLDQQRYVNVDTLPEGTVYDLGRFDEGFQSDPSVGCVFSTRYGIRVSTSNPDSIGSFVGGDRSELLPAAVRRFFFVDGANFACRPQLYINWFSRHPNELTAGDGSYGFVLAWEAKMGKLLYDQQVTWVDLYRDARYRTIADVDAIEECRGEKISLLWYDCRHYYFFYGRDQQVYPPTPLRPLLRYAVKNYLPGLIRYSRDKRLTFVNPDSLAGTANS